MEASFEYTYHCPDCGHDCVTWFYEEPFAHATITCCCGNDILIESVDTEKHELTCSSLADIYNSYIESK